MRESNNNLVSNIMKKDVSQKVKWGNIFPLALLFLGVCLLVYMITYEDEPGALPLILIISGLVILAMNWYKTKKQL